MADAAFGSDRVISEPDAGLGKTDLMIILPGDTDYTLMELKRDFSQVKLSDNFV